MRGLINVANAGGGWFCIYASLEDGREGKFGAVLQKDNADGTFQLRYLEHRQYGMWAACPEELIESLPKPKLEEQEAMEQDREIVIFISRSAAKGCRRKGHHARSISR